MNAGEEIKRSLESGNACYRMVQNILSSSLLSKSIKITHPILCLCPVGIPTVLWTKKKKQLKGHFSSHAEVIAAADTWLEGRTTF
jgi:hypothetical protein